MGSASLTAGTPRSDEDAAAVLCVRGLVGATESVRVGPISFSLGGGQCLGVIGESGSGKTTALRCLSLFRRPLEGAIELRDHDSKRWRIVATEQPSSEFVAAFRRRLVYVAQSTSLWPHLSVKDNVALAMRRVLRLDETTIDARCAALFKALELTGLDERRPWEISGGEARRVTVARGLALEPSVLLLDEIEAGLDSARAERQMELVRQTCALKGAAIVVVTHTPWVTTQFSEKLLVLSKGAVVEQGNTRDIVSNTSSSYVQALLKSENGSTKSPRTDLGVPHNSQGIAARGRSSEDA